MNHELEQAAHKAAYEKGRRDERAAVVSWLRNWMKQRKIADRIAEGAHG